MPTLAQKYLKGQDVPDVLEYHLLSDPAELARSIQGLYDELSPARVIGLAVHFTQTGTMEYVSLAVDGVVFVLSTKAEKATSRKAAPVPHPLQAVLEGRNGKIIGVGMARLAMYIKHHLGFHTRGFELFDILPHGKEEGDSDMASPGCAAKHLFPSSDSFIVDNLWDFSFEDVEDEAIVIEYLCFRAWITARQTRPTPIEFEHIFRMVSEVNMMDAAEPRTFCSDFGHVSQLVDGHVVVQNGRFSTRVRKSDKTRVIFVDINGKEHAGRAKSMKGKQTYVQPLRGISKHKIKGVRVVGREELTNAERARENFILHLLQGKCTLTNPAFPFIRHIWFPSGRRKAPVPVTHAKARKGQADRLLNQSQSNVVEAMVSTSEPIVVTHGPPGTGKTTTISVAVMEMCSLGRTTWVVAQSNVGVKNIAESLHKHGGNFKLIVSKEFYVEWHEHLYGDVEDNLIRTDEFPGQPRDVDLLFSGISIVLCTLSTLSNPVLVEKRIFELVPVENLVVDEASQIGVFNYLHLFGRFKELKKACFFGDPKQLPPYGQDTAPTMQSIFDIEHLQSSAYFLDTQYRMPTRLGAFISQAVYSGKLKSKHDIKSHSCVKFIDVCNGEETKHGKSWKNMREVQTIIHLAQSYYKGKDYRIITPYDGQRAAILEALKRHKLPYDNVFNVDSFQGNEAQYIIVSVVRTTGPGFLRSQNRVNVMLTRCRAGMIIISSKRFMRHSSVQKTLLGKLVAHWETQVGKPSIWHDWRHVAEQKVDLPGAPGKKSKEAPSSARSLELGMDALSLRA
ncbi:hypothetical protein M0805_008208 [Coniferiporia weirii]|nr:hypothetical protein M0805_008208 [Coniferiporia weirii]